MWSITCLNLCLVVVVSTKEYYKDEIETPTRTSETPGTLYMSRCTRRFTPGVCEEPVSPVWTFHFHLQNCTERLGCATSHRTNRFRTYAMCMSRCRPLVNVYLQILASTNHTQLFNLQQKLIGQKGRREGEEDLVNANIMLPDIHYREEEEVEENITRGEPLFNLYYRDESDGEVSLPPDIDYEVNDIPSDNLYEE